MSYSTRYFWLKFFQLRSKCAAPDSGTDTLIYNKQVLRNTALHIHHRKVHMSLKTGLIQSTQTVRSRKTKTTFVISKWWHSLLQSSLMFRSKWNSPKVNVNYMMAICLYQWNTIVSFLIKIIEDISYWIYIYSPAFITLELYHVAWRSKLSYSHLLQRYLSAYYNLNIKLKHLKWFPDNSKLMHWKRHCNDLSYYRKAALNIGLLL